MPENSTQLTLIPNTCNPLVERLGAEWFESLPQEPGVYRMVDGKGKLLYVGKAKNLRTRLLWYRRARRDKVSRKTVRLLREVWRIEYELCETEEQALLRENALIREERPPFNRAKKEPETYYFIHLRSKPDALHFRLDMTGESGDGWQSYGAFKGHRFTRRAMGALLRQCYFRVHTITRACELPLVLTRNLTPLHFCLALPGGSPGPAGTDDPAVMARLVHSYLEGSEDLISTWPAEEGDGIPEGFTRTLLESDAEALDEFFQRRCRFNYRMAQETGRSSHLIPQLELDDLIARSVFR